MRRNIERLVAAASLAVFAGVSFPSFAVASQSVQASSVTSLEPGQFVWQPDVSADGEVVVVVSIPLQAAYVYRGGELIGLSTVSTGKAGHETPPGRFEILQKRREHYSNKYNNAPMPFMQRLTWSGVALHGGEIPGYPASHGCIRLPNRFARHLFEVTRLGAAVHVLDMPVSADDALQVATSTPPAADPVQLASGVD